MEREAHIQRTFGIFSIFIAVIQAFTLIIYGGLLPDAAPWNLFIFFGVVITGLGVFGMTLALQGVARESTKYRKTCMAGAISNAVVLVLAIIVVAVDVIISYG